MLRDAFQGSSEHSDAISEQRTVCRVVDVALDHGGVGSQLPTVRHLLLPGLGNDPLMDTLRNLRAQKAKAPAEGGVVGRGIRIEAGEAPIHQVGADLSLQLSERPPLEVLHHTTTKKTVRRDAGPSRSWRKRMAFGQPLPNKPHEFRVIEQCVDWIEKVVLEEHGLSSQRHVEQGLLPAGRSDH